MKRIEIVEFLKGYSIFTIVIFHYLLANNMPSPLDKLVFFGGTGIHLFILLSGFGLYLSYLKKQLPYMSYLKRRFSKVYIPYIFVVSITALIALIIPIFDNSLYAYGGHLFLYKMFDEAIIGSYGYPLWFISMIFQFYLLFYLIVAAKKRLSNSTFMIVCLVISLLWALLLVYLGRGSFRIWNSFFLQYLWEFAIGMVLAYLIFNNQFKINIKKHLYLVIGIVGCIIYASLALWAGVVGKLFNDIPALIGYSSLAIWLYSLKISWVNNFFLYTGKISYSVYLLHILVYQIISVQFGQLPVPVIIAASLAFTYLFSNYFQIVIGKIYQLLKI